MTQATSKFDRAFLRLQTVAKNGPTVASEPIEAADYDWNAPCSFTSAQLDKIERLSARAAACIAGKLGEQLHEEIQLSTVPLSQHYAGRLALSEGGADSYHFSVMREDREQCGLVVIPGQLARRWVGKALGDSETASDSEREFSPLESALMRDVVVAVVEVLSGEYRAVGGGGLQCGRQVSAEDALPEARDEDEYCMLVFRVGEGDDKAVLSFVLASEVLSEVAGCGITSKPGDKPSEDSRDNLLACIDQASVTAGVSLMTIELSLRQVMNLEVGDVLISDVCVGQPLELLVGGGVVFSGHPVSCDGRYALQIAT